ncbi:GNAT family N-acetyltransferase [Chloroflexia bacterium SDU3-3]|nr:GNAT family N-acetyltransferase [Chloroflexia bacterium SDU3-3]
MISYAKIEDIVGILELDKHIAKSILEHKIRNSEVYVARENSTVIGVLRYSLFWDNTPFMNMLYIRSAFQRKGLGLSMVIHWEAEMSAKGYHSVMTSTQSNETAQHFYRKIGYKDIGGLLLPNEPLEIVFMKEIAA